MDWAARMMDFRPEPQALLTVNAGTESGIPARKETWRAGLGPQPGGTGVPENRFLDFVGPDARFAQQRLGDGNTEVDRRDVLESPAEAADRSAFRMKNKNFSHNDSLIMDSVSCQWSVVAVNEQLTTDR